MSDSDDLPWVVNKEVIDMANMYHKLAVEKDIPESIKGAVYQAALDNLIYEKLTPNPYRYGGVKLSQIGRDVFALLQRKDFDGVRSALSKKE